MDHNFSIDAKEFLESCCRNVQISYENLKLKDNFRMLGEKCFYNFFIDTIHIKFLIYKLTEFKMIPRNEETSFNNILNSENVHKEIMKISRNDANDFLQSVIKNVSEEHRLYINNMVFKIVGIQRRFRGYLSRLISKMEMMNIQIQRELEQALQRQKVKINLKRKSVLKK